MAAEPEQTSLPTIEILEKSTAENAQRLHATKLPVPSREVPISIEALDPNLIEQSGYLQLSDLLDIATSAISIASDGGIVNEVMLRGFSDSTFYRNGLNDSLGQLTSRTLVNIERVEILKGPNAALQGPGEPGGSINYVTKRPQSEPLLEASAEFGYFDAMVLNVDATGPIGRSDNWQYRLVASREQGDTFRDFINNDRWFVAPSLAWQPTLSIDVLASVEFVRNERLLDTGVIALKGLPSLPSDRFLGEPASGPAEIEGLTVQLSSSIRLPPAWEIGIDMQAQSTRVDGTAVEPAGFDGRKLLREVQNRNEKNDAWVVQIEAAGPLTIWNMRHDVLIGIEGTALNEDVTLLSSDSDLAPFAIDPLSPVYGQPFPQLAPERQSAEQRRQISAYVQDLWTISDRWRLLFGGRFDYIDQSGSDRTVRTRFDNATGRFSPRVSLVHIAEGGLTWYASYSESIDPNEGLKPDGGALIPTLGEAIEAGIRWESSDRRFSFDTAVFGIRQTNVTVDAPGNPGFEIQTGEQRNLGVDVELNVNLPTSLVLRARYNFLDTKITKDPFIPNGTRGLNAPRHQGGLLATYTASLRRPQDLKLGLAVNYVGERQASLEPGELDLRLEDYVRADAFVQWEYSRHLEFQMRFENLTDESFIQGSQSDALRLTPGAPFAVRGEIQITF
ncbi:MAG: TonB-dependent receptor [Gammaproteobacteria bacterium]|nr:TonB-dependent receptor [Gammaproteobacteria bacterium]